MFRSIFFVVVRCWFVLVSWCSVVGVYESLVWSVLLDVLLYVFDGLVYVFEYVFVVCVFGDLFE